MDNRAAEGLTVENSIYKGFELSWPSFAGEGGIYHIVMKKVSSFKIFPKTIYKGEETYFTITNLELGAEYEFQMKCKFENGWGEWSEAVVKKIEGLNVHMAINTLMNYSRDEAICDEIFNWMTEYTQKSDNVVEAANSGVIEVVSDMIQTHINNTKMCSYILDILWNITNKNDDNKAKAGDQGTIDIIINMLYKNLNDDIMCKKGCSVLGALATNTDNKIKAVKLGAIDVATKILFSHIDNTSICEAVFVLFKNIIYRNDGNQFKLGKSGAIDVIVEIMNDCIDNADIFVSGCSVLYEISLFNADSKIMLTKLGTMEVIYKAFIKHHTNKEVCKQGCSTLNQLLKVKNNNIRASEIGFINILPKLITENIDNCYTCRLLCSIIKEIVDTDINNQNKAAEAGAIIAVLNAVRTHINDDYTCEYGCKAIVSICWDNAKAIETGLVHTVTSVINKHIDIGSVCEFGCSALGACTLSSYDVRDEKINTAAIEAVIKALNKYPNDFYIAARGVLAIHRIAEVTENLKLEWIGVILKAVNINMNKSVVCSAGLKAILAIAKNFNSVPEPIRLAAIDTATQILVTHIKNPSLCFHGCFVIYGFALTPDFKSIKINPETVHAISEAMKAHINDVVVCCFGCNATRVIAYSDDGRITTGDSEMIPILLQALQTHTNDSNVRKFSCGAIGNIVLNAKYRAEALSLGFIDILLDIMKKFNDSPDTSSYWNLALCNISSGSSSIQDMICKKGGVDILLDELRTYEYLPSMSDSIFRTIGTILSSAETQSKYCTDKVLTVIREYHEKYNEYEEVKQFYLSLTKENDPRVKRAVIRGECTKDACPKCDNDCGIEENNYCIKCCVQQKAYRCYTCDGEEGRPKYYCEVCWQKNHQGHKCEEFFYPIRCATK